MSDRPRPSDDIFVELGLTKDEIERLKRIHVKLKGMTRAEGKQYAAEIRRGFKNKRENDEIEHLASTFASTMNMTDEGNQDSYTLTDLFNDLW